MINEPIQQETNTGGNIRLLNLIANKLSINVYESTKRAGSTDEELIERIEDQLDRFFNFHIEVIQLLMTLGTSKI